MYRCFLLFASIPLLNSCLLFVESNPRSTKVLGVASSIFSDDSSQIAVVEQWWNEGCSGSMMRCYPEVTNGIVDLYITDLNGNKIRDIYQSKAGFVFNDDDSETTFYFSRNENFILFPFGNQSYDSILLIDTLGNHVANISSLNIKKDMWLVDFREIAPSPNGKVLAIADYLHEESHDSLYAIEIMFFTLKSHSLLFQDTLLLENTLQKASVYDRVGFKWHQNGSFTIGSTTDSLAYTFDSSFNVTEVPNAKCFYPRSPSGISANEHLNSIAYDATDSTRILFPSLDPSLNCISSTNQ